MSQNLCGAMDVDLIGTKIFLIVAAISIGSYFIFMIIVPVYIFRGFKKVIQLTDNDYRLEQKLLLRSLILQVRLGTVTGPSYTSPPQPVCILVARFPLSCSLMCTIYSIKQTIKEERKGCLFCHKCDCEKKLRKGIT